MAGRKSQIMTDATNSKSAKTKSVLAMGLFGRKSGKPAKSSACSTRLTVKFPRKSTEAA